MKIETPKMGKKILILVLKVFFKVSLSNIISLKLFLSKLFLPTYIISAYTVLDYESLSLVLCSVNNYYGTKK